jgi:hypothetical protein
MECAYALKTGKMVTLSEQQMLDCDILRPIRGNNGCKGGFPQLSLFYAKDGIQTGQSYPVYIIKNNLFINLFYMFHQHKVHKREQRQNRSMSLFDYKKRRQNTPTLLFFDSGLERP